MESVYKRKGCGPQALGSPKKQVVKKTLDGLKDLAKNPKETLKTIGNNLYESTIGKVDTKEERSDLYNKAKEGYNKLGKYVKENPGHFGGGGMYGAIKAGQDNEVAQEGLNEAPDSSNKKKANCWKGYKAVGKKKSPSGKKTKGGKTKMVNNCVKIKK